MDPAEHAQHLKSSLSLRWVDVFPESGKGDDPFLEVTEWSDPVTYFVGRNGSGKSKTVRAIRKQLNAHLLSTDRLTGVKRFLNQEWGSIERETKGLPIEEASERQALVHAQEQGFATREFYTLRNEPAVWLRVAAFLRSAVGRTVHLRERAGYLDPTIQVGTTEYSLLRDEGHGLRELVVLLTAIYTSNWRLLIVDEPELHLHPSMARLWLTELNRECQRTGRRAIVVTHEPSLVKPRNAQDLHAIWLFRFGQSPQRMSDAVLELQYDRVTASLNVNPQLVSQIVFSPRPVLVEGEHDVAALSAALARLCEPAVVAQTDLINCGGNGTVALWYEICRKLGIDIRAIADLDSCLKWEVQRVLDAVPEVRQGYETGLTVHPPTTANVLRQLIDAANAGGVETTEKARSAWLAALDETDGANRARLDKLLEIWRHADFWLHREGTLEQVLGIAVKGTEPAARAAALEGGIDEVALWCAYQLDPTGDVATLLRGEVERVAHTLMREQGRSPEAVFTSLIGPTAESDSKLMHVEALGGGRYRLIVDAPDEFRGYWVEFSRETPTSELILNNPGS